MLFTVVKIKGSITQKYAIDIVIHVLVARFVGDLFLINSFKQMQDLC